MWMTVLSSKFRKELSGDALWQWARGRGVGLYYPFLLFDCLGCGINAFLSGWIPGFKKNGQNCFE